MVIFELDDFDFWVENSVVTEEGFSAFSPLFVFLLYWAFCEDLLSSELMNDESFVTALKSLKNDRSSFFKFVTDELDGKLCDSYFSDSVKGFVCDYYEYDGYSKDLVKCFNLNLWQLPCSLERARELFTFINSSLINYKRNQKANASIIDFTSTE